MFLGINKTNFSSRLAARAKVSLSRAKNIFMPTNINSIVILFCWYLCPVKSSSCMGVNLLTEDYKLSSSFEVKDVFLIIINHCSITFFYKFHEMVGR